METCQLDKIKKKGALTPAASAETVCLSETLGWASHPLLAGVLACFSSRPLLTLPETPCVLACGSGEMCCRPHRTSWAWQRGPSHSWAHSPPPGGHLPTQHDRVFLPSRSSTSSRLTVLKGVLLPGGFGEEMCFHSFKKKKDYRCLLPVVTQTERSLPHCSPGPGGEDPPLMSNK